VLWGLENTKFATGVRAATGMKPKVLAEEISAAESHSGIKTTALRSA
jgi:hypothetical protein